MLHLTASSRRRDVIPERARPWSEIALDPSWIRHLVGDARMILFGEATHGTHEFYAARAELTRQFGLELVWMHVAHRVKQLRHLALTGANDAWIRMPRCRHTERRCQVQILLSLGIPNMHALRAFPHDGPRTVRFNERDVARLVAAQQIESLFCRHP